MRLRRGLDGHRKRRVPGGEMGRQRPLSGDVHGGYRIGLSRPERSVDFRFHSPRGQRGQPGLGPSSLDLIGQLVPPFPNVRFGSGDDRVLAYEVRAQEKGAGLIQAQSSPTSEQAKRIEALVNKAAALVEAKGKAAAFSEFRKRDSEWWFGNTYVFAYDQNLNVLLNPAFPKREGTNTRGEKDVNGKAFRDEFLRVVQAKGSGWVDYMYPKPGQTQPAQKWSYVKALNIDGTPGIIGAGFYPE